MTHKIKISAARNVTVEIISIFDLFDWSIVLFCCFYKCYNAFLKTIECHICDERIRIRDWKNKSSSNGHRKQCSENNKEFLKSLPEPFDVRCLTCFNYLKLLPKVNPMNQISIKHYFSNLMVSSLYIYSSPLIWLLGMRENIPMWWSQLRIFQRNPIVLLRSN